MNNNNGFELHGLEKLIATFLSTLNPDVVCEVVTEVERIKHRLLESVATIDREDGVRRYVRAHQYSLVAIMDRFDGLEDNSHARSCYSTLMGLLQFLRDQFPAHLDDLGRAPLTFMRLVGTRIVASAERLEKELRRICRFPQLVYMILYPLERFCLTVDRQRISVHRVRHLMYILKYGFMVGKKTVKEDFGEPLIRLLLYLNYNSRSTFVQFTEFLGTVVPSDMETRHRIATLEHFLKVVSQATVKADTGYDPHAPTLKGQLTLHLTTELDILRNIRQQEAGDGLEW